MSDYPTAWPGVLDLVFAATDAVGLRLRSDVHQTIAGDSPNP